MRALTRRGFIAVVASAPFAPDSPAPRLLTMEEMVAAYDEMMGIGRRAPLREVTFYKGTSVGMTTSVLENVIGYLSRVDPMPKWVDSDIKTDLRNALSYLSAHRLGSGT